MDLAALKNTLMQAEGFRASMFFDSLGFATIGFGRMIDKRLNGGITTAEAEILLDNDIQTAINTVDEHFPWVSKLSDTRQRAITELCFEMGIERLNGFQNMLIDLENYNFTAASLELLNSKYAQQVPERAARIAGMIKSG